VHNFDYVPVIDSLDDFWHRKWGEDDDGKIVRLATADQIAQTGDRQGVHLPSPSYWPLVLAIGLPIIGYGVIFNLWLSALGGIIVLGAIYGWIMEPADDPNTAHGHDDHHDDDHDDGNGDGAAPEPTDSATEEAPVG
jgi:cytochrome c oxidase subunit 1